MKMMATKKTIKKITKLTLGMPISATQYADIKKCSRQTVYNAMAKNWIDYSIEHAWNNTRVIICTQRTIDWKPGKTIPRNLSKLKLSRLKRGELTSGK
jgi:hypothetical protein